MAVFRAASTQWSTDWSGRLRLHYEALPMIMRYCNVPRAEHAATFRAVRTMEIAVLEEARHGR